MLVLFEVLGVLAGALVLAGIVSGGVGRRSFARAAAVVPAALACTLLGTGLWPTVRNIVAEGARQAALPAEEAQSAPGRSADVEIDFVDWAKQRVGPDQTFYVLGGERGLQWTTFRLLPALAVDQPEDAEWLVFYDREPEEADEYDPARFQAPEVFDEGFAVAHRRG